MTKVNKKNSAKKEVALFNQEKRELMSYLNMDGDGTASLNGLWEFAGCPKSKDPKFWLRLPDTVRFLDSAERILNVRKSHLLKIKRGKGGGTRGVQQIVLEYAKYLDTDLSVLVNEVFFQRIEEEKNPDLIVDRAISTYKKKGKTDEWITRRLKGKGKRNEFTSCLAEHGVEQEGFRNCTNAIYIPLYGGTTAVIREKKNLPEKANIRDNMTDFEIDTISFIESLSKQTIEKENLQGNAKCEIACSRAANIVAEALMKNNKSL